MIFTERFALQLRCQRLPSYPAPRSPMGERALLASRRLIQRCLSGILAQHRLPLAQEHLFMMITITCGAGIDVSIASYDAGSTGIHDQHGPRLGEANACHRCR
jgi:hypothetical protein